MRDRLISLGKRHPCRINDEDFDVPILEVHEFEIKFFPEDSHIFHPAYTLIRDITTQPELTALCIAKAELCACIGHV